MKPLYSIINKISGHIEGSNGNKYLTLYPTDESKNTLKTYKELWNEIRDSIRTITNNTDKYDENI